MGMTVWELCGGGGLSSHPDRGSPSLGLASNTSLPSSGMTRKLLDSHSALISCFCHSSFQFSFEVTLGLPSALGGGMDKGSTGNETINGLKNYKSSFIERETEKQ